ncbi:NUDIX domain-containing protein [Trichlorobacter lovleyi]|uniref:NUDIX domain-containing protein n=1 Tax=Trichlorobacter lovleyi TaxID=313985 RepID=UPI003D137753
MIRLPARTVVISILYDLSGRILLQQRSDDAAYMPGRWAYFGGGVESGESVEQALIRETQEELGYMLVRPVLLLEQAFDLNGQPAYMYVYLEEFCGDKGCLQLLEGKGWGWFGPDELLELGMLPRDLAIAEAAFHKIHLLNGRRKIVCTPIR